MISLKVPICVIILNKPRMVRVGTTRMAQNTHRTEMILMFEKITWVKNTGKHSLFWDSNPALVDLVDFKKAAIVTKFGSQVYNFSIVGI